MVDMLLREDAKRERRMARGSSYLRNAIDKATGARRIPDKLLPGSDLMWTDEASGSWRAGEASPLQALMEHRCERLAAEREAMFARIVERDACPYCGTRADLHGRKCGEIA